LFDTAGLRRRAKVDDTLEEMAGADALRAIRFAQVVVIVIDATMGLERQDLTIASLVVDEGRAPLLALNKWDRIADRKSTLDAVAQRLDQSLPQVRGLRVVPVSALTGEGLDGLLPTVLQVYDIWNRQLSTSRLNRWLAEMTARQPPPSAHGRPVKIRYMSQNKTRPPGFVLFANRPESVPESYLRYLSNGLRDSFGLQGVPLRLTLRRTRNPYVSGGTG
jgi:GTP-binding protein